MLVFLSVALRRTLSVRTDGHGSVLREGWRESLALVNHQIEEVLVSAGIVLSVGQKASAGGPGGERWPRITSPMNSAGC